MTPHFRKKRSFSKNRSSKDKKTAKKKSAYTPKQNQVVVNSYSEEWLKKNFDIVYSKEIVQEGEGVHSGSEVEIVSINGKFLGKGIRGSGEIAIRRFSTVLEDLQESFFTKRFEAALYRRSIPDDTNAWRWIHAENDDLPGIVVEVWADEISIILSDVSLESWLDMLLSALSKVRLFRRAWGHVRLGEGKQKDLGLLSTKRRK